MTTPEYEYYGLIVKYWDFMRGDTSKWEDRYFFWDVIRKYGQPVLDIGCAGGRLLLDYMSNGVDIDGVDISPEMIAICRENAEKKGLKPNLYTQSMTALDLPRKYKTILVPSSSFQLLLEPSQPEQALRCIFEHLLPGGAFATPIMALWQAGEPLENEFTRERERPEDGAIVRRTSWSRFDPVTQLEHSRDLWEVIRDGQVIESELHEQSPATRSFSREEIVSLMEQAGFQNIQLFSGFSFDRIEPDDTLFSVIGIKP